MFLISIYYIKTPKSSYFTIYVYPGVDIPIIKSMNTAGSNPDQFVQGFTVGIIAYGNVADGKNHFRLGVYDIGVPGTTLSNFLSPSMARNIDTKLDDGLPCSGIVIPFNGGGINESMSDPPSYSGNATISSSYTSGCIIGTSYANGVTINQYNIAASNDSQLCTLDVVFSQ
ncbi:hypothetical protein SZ25_00658 [Candidatus Arcanobacter lacustris]|uniref:Uncharacterized protein n=1 Tax=Candidatus Arcanibacter lacustris TaxID=1607817 RepID=A0A0F5MN66_9RICK|nr:hypothetical protein SZ25_00658 [Candidatus Arcanobacter lacustris]